MPDRMLDRIFYWLYGAYQMRANAVTRAVMHAHMVASIVATDAPPAIVEQYIAECARLDRNARRWGVALTALGGLVPGYMWAFGILLDGWHSASTWGIVAAQFAWIGLWFFLGWPRLEFSIAENRMLGTYAALRPLCDNASQDVRAQAGVAVTSESLNG